MEVVPVGAGLVYLVYLAMGWIWLDSTQAEMGDLADKHVGVLVTKSSGCNFPERNPSECLNVRGQT